MELEKQNEIAANNTAFKEQNPIQNLENQPETREKKGVGALIGVVIIVIILIIGALYFWQQKINKEIDEARNLAEENSKVQTVLSPQINDTDLMSDNLDLSKTDEIADLEADLNSIQIENVENIDLESEQL